MPYDFPKKKPVSKKDKRVKKPRKKSLLQIFGK